MTKNLNDMNFKLMVYLSLIFVLINVTWLVVSLVINNGYISTVNGKGIDSMSLLIIIILSIVLFKRDRDLLKQNQAYCPSWGWYFLFPAYIYLRQKRNALGLSYFWIYMVCTFVLAKIAMQISISIITNFLI